MNTISTKHGGVRPGAGRKKNSGRFKEDTKVMRIPMSLVDSVTKTLDIYKTRIQNNIQLSVPSAHAAELSIPIFSSSVQAGFPSPADDHLENELDLNEHLIHRKEATFFVRAQGDSMLNAGIHSGDILIVDKSLPAVSGKVVIAVIDGEFTVKRLHKHGGRIKLKAENPDFEDIDIEEGSELIIWGVVTSVIHQYD